MSNTNAEIFESRIYFLRELKQLVRRIPIKAYEQPENREIVLDVIQEAMDSLIAREEEDEDEAD